jgi:hypothetical protein
MNQTTNDIRTIRIIWGGLLFTIVIYGLLAYMAVRNPAPGPFESAFSNPIVLVLQIIGVGMFFLAFVMSSVFLRRRPAGPRAPAAPVTSGVVSVTPRMRLALIVRWAMIESTAIFGLLAAFLSQDPRVFLPLGGLAIGGMLMSYPSDERLRSMMPA